MKKMKMGVQEMERGWETMTESYNEEGYKGMTLGNRLEECELSNYL